MPRMCQSKEYRRTKSSQPRDFSFRNPHSAFRNRPHALTLIEMLVSMAITLVMMAAVVTLFANIGASVTNRRAIIEISSQLRMARMRLQKDLMGATCDGIPKSYPGSNDKEDGYIEIVEGQWSDKNPSGLISAGTLDFKTSLVPSSQYPDPAYIGHVTDGAGLGAY